MGEDVLLISGILDSESATEVSPTGPCRKHDIARIARSGRHVLATITRSKIENSLPGSGLRTAPCGPRLDSHLVAQRRNNPVWQINIIAVTGAALGVRGLATVIAEYQLAALISTLRQLRIKMPDQDTVRGAHRIVRIALKPIAMNDCALRAA